MPETTQFGAPEEDIFGEGTLKPNTILVNRYKVLGVLGGGGQGAVYNCRDLNFPDAKRLVAVKEMHYPSNDPGVRSATLATFQREANILATLSHPAIPKIYDFFDQNNRAYLVMEYINGSDLEMLLNRTKELPLTKVIDWSIELCDVLHYLHSHQPEPIIFRDVKPANIMVDSLGKVRLIDFGIAKIFVSGVKNTMIGTEGYSAPEQYKGDVNPLSDIYSLGATLHHIITRKDPRLEPPFSFHERPIRDSNPKAPESLQAILDKALSMDPVDRFQSCEEMRQALENLKYRGGRSLEVSVDPSKLTISGTEFFEGGEFELEATIEPRWVFKTEDEIRVSPTSYKNLAYVGSYDTNIWAVDMETGAFKWKYATTGGIASSPAIDNSVGLILFGSEDTTFYALDAQTGRLAWTQMTDGMIRSSPTVAHDHVFFGSDDGKIYALTAANGRLLWEYDTAAPVRTKPYVTKDLVIVGSESGELVGLELSGSRKWGTDLSKRARPISASPYVDEEEGICYVGAFDGYIYAVDISNGYTMWRFRTNKPIVSSVAQQGTSLVFGSVDGTLYCINSETAKEKWRFTLEKPIVASPIIHKDAVYFGATDGFLYCLDIKSGKERWNFQTGDAITSTCYIVNNLLVFGSMDHTLYAIPLVG